MGDMTGAHFIFIPAVLLLGVVIGWILGSRAAADAYGAALRRGEARGREKASGPRLERSDPVSDRAPSASPANPAGRRS